MDGDMRMDPSLGTNIGEAVKAASAIIDKTMSGGKKHRYTKSKRSKSKRSKSKRSIKYVVSKRHRRSTRSKKRR
jgi:hypothetical protein